MPHLLFILSLFMVFELKGQLFAVTGTVRNSDTREPAPWCTVRLLPDHTTTVTDNQGRFVLHVRDTLSRLSLVVSSAGYEGDTIYLLAARKDHLILLRPLPGSLNEIVVTGVSKATLARENPVPAASVSLAKMEQTVAGNIVDVLVRNVPGLNAMKTGPNVSKPFIRGLGFNRVLTLYDGVRQEGQQWGYEHGMEADAYNIEKAEVIKGPASLMYGSDALAGVVSLFPAMPHEADGKLHGYVFSEYQSNNGLWGQALRLTYGSNRWSFALRGSRRMAKNYTNAVDGAVYNTGFRETNFSALAAFTAKHGYSRFNITFYNNLQGIPDGSRDSITRQFTQQVAEAWNDDVKQRPIVSEEALHSYNLSPLHQHIRHYRMYSNHHYEVDKGAVDITLAFQQNIRAEFSHPARPQQPGLQVRLSTFNYGIRYHAPVFRNIEISSGINGMYQHNRNGNATDFPIPDHILFDAGMFGHVKWKDGNWTISGGLRYDTRYLEGYDLYTGTDLNTGFNRQVMLPDTLEADHLFHAFTRYFRGISASAGITYQASRQISVRANIARGYRAPNITELSSNGLDPGAHIIYLGDRSFGPEFGLQEDIGITGVFSDLSASVSIFNNHISHYIYLSQLTDATGDPVTDIQGNKTFRYQQSAAHLYGMEMTLDLHPSFMKGFGLNNSLSLLRGSNRRAEYRGKGTQGEYLPLIPPLKLLSSIAQQVATGWEFLPLIDMKLEADINGAQGRFLGLYDTETATPGYCLLNAGIGMDIRYHKNTRLKLLLQVNNLADVAYQSNMSRLKYFEYYPSSPNGRQGIYEMGRNICLRVIASW